MIRTLKIREERLSRKLTLKDVSEKTGVTKATVHDIETGRCKPSYEVLIKLMELYEYTNPRKLFEPTQDDSFPTLEPSAYITD